MPLSKQIVNGYRGRLPLARARSRRRDGRPPVSPHALGSDQGPAARSDPRRCRPDRPSLHPLAGQIRAGPRAAACSCEPRGACAAELAGADAAGGAAACFAAAGAGAAAFGGAAGAAGFGRDFFGRDFFGRGFFFGGHFFGRDFRFLLRRRPRVRSLRARWALPSTLRSRRPTPLPGRRRAPSEASA